jgi:hypothetical protein
MNADHVEPFVTMAAKRCEVADPITTMSPAPANDLFPIDDHCRLTGEDDTSFSIGMLMQSRAGRLPRKKDTPAPYGSPSKSTVAIAPFR